MTEPKLLRVGRVTLEGAQTTFEPEPSSFRARHDEQLELVLSYRYREPTRDKDETRLRFRAKLGDQDLPVADELIGDDEGRSDDRHSYLSIPVRALPPGRHEGRYVVEAEYRQEDWKSGAVVEEKRHRHEGTFVLEVQ